MGSGSKARVLILGGGFGGLYTALRLEKALAADAGVEVTLVNRENFSRSGWSGARNASLRWRTGGLGLAA